MNRRQFFLSTVSIGGLSLIISGISEVSCNINDKQSNIEVYFPSFLGVLLDEQEIISIGKLYLKISGMNPDVNQLMGLLNERIGIDSLNRKELQISAMLEKRVLEDFENSDMVLTSGWILARTEALQCAMFSLLS